MMSELITHTAKLVPYAKRRGSVPSFVTAYEYEPPADEAHAKHGKLFVVVEVLASGRMATEVVDLLIEAIGTHYYNDPNEYASALERFEQAVKGVNGDLSAYINEGHSAWIGKMSAVLAVLAEDTLHVTQTGSAEAYLYRGPKAVHIVAASGAVHQANKTFAAIASGELSPGDRFLLTTPALVHQFSAKELTDIITTSSPNAAIAKFHELMGKDSAADRVAALIVEITTPELAALQVRDTEPDEIQLGAPENMLEAAKLATAPLAQGALHTGKKLAKTTQGSLVQAKPYARSWGLKAAQFMRWLLTGRGAKQRLAIIGAAILLVTAFLVWNQVQIAALNKLTKRYYTDASSFSLAKQDAATGNKTGARQLLQQLTPEVASLQSNPGHKSIDKAVHARAQSLGQPASLAQLASAISSELDSLDNIVRVSPSVVVDLTTIKNAKPAFVEVINGKAVVIDSNSNAIYLVDLTKDSYKTSGADSKDIGKVTATAVSSSGDGVYLLTATPSVWLYKPADDSLTKQVAAGTSWPTAKAIASYNGNLYLLANDSLYKHTPIAAGFSSASSYLSTAQAPVISGGGAIDVDGSIFISGTTGISRTLSGTVQQTLALPDTLKHATNLHGTEADGVLCLADTTSGRFGEITFSGGQMVYRAQYILNGISQLTNATCNSASKTAYALADGKLVKFTLQP